MPDGCIHSQAATESQLEAFGYAVKLQLAIVLGQSHFHAACKVCNNTSLPMCCLDCDFIGCPHHSDHGSVHHHHSKQNNQTDQNNPLHPVNESVSKASSGNSHMLACCLGTEYEGTLWCFECMDVILDQKFENRRMIELERVLGVRSLVCTVPLKQPVFHASTGLRGFMNLGATCYVSVVLQSLIHNPLVRAFYLGGGHEHEKCRKRSCLACSLDRIYSNFFGSAEVGGYGITDMLIALAEKQPLMGAGSTEQDAHEFYLMLLDDIHNSHLANQPLGEKCDEVSKCGCVAHRSFGGVTESTLKCTCGQMTKKCEPIVDLGLDLSSDQYKPTTLEACLRGFTTSELIANYTCENCGFQNSTCKQLKISQLPPVILIQLKRFKHLGNKGSIKVNTPVNFSLQIDMAPYMATDSPTPLIYELYGVICHTGTLDTGHYTCMMKHSSGQWFNFDDVMITTIDVDKVLKSQQAYLLFYIVKWAV